MSKELEMLKEIKEKFRNDNNLLRRLNAIEKALKALETIKICNNECPDNNKIIRFSCYDRPSYISDKELHIDYLVIGNACFVISPEEKDCLKEVLL